jgi:HK97 family phage portal protein
MGLAERVMETYRARTSDAQLASPVAPAMAPPFEGYTGHPPDYDSERYGQYLATSNDVYAAAALRARVMGGLDLQVFNGKDAQKREVPNHPAAKLLDYVNPFWTRRRLTRMDELSMCIWGESFWAVEGALEGNPTEIWWCKPTNVQPVPDPKGYLKRFLYLPTTGGTPIPFEPEEIVWFRYPNPNDEFQSQSPLTSALLAADTGRAMLATNANLFRQGLMAGGLVVPDSDKVTFSKRQAEELEEALEKRWTGADKAHRWSVLRYEAQLKSLNVTPKDAQFVEGLGLMARQIWNALGVPAPLLNDLAYATLANLREFRQQLWTNALLPDSQLRSDEIVQQFLPMFSSRPGPPAAADYAAYDYSKVPELQQLARESWDRDRQAMEVGALTINEWRQQQGLPPVPWGDVWWAPANKSAVAGKNSKPQGDTSPSGNGQPPGQGGGSQDGEQVDAEQAAGALATIDLAAMELRHGPFTLSGRNGKGHR